MREIIRNTKLEIIGYRDISDPFEILRDKHGRTLGTYNRATKVTRDSQGRIVGYLVNQLLRLL